MRYLTGILLMAIAAHAATPEIPIVEQPLRLTMEEIASREQNRRYWVLRVESTEKCACSKCEFESAMFQDKNEFEIQIGKINPPMDCLEPALPAVSEFKLPVEEREYFVTVNRERHRLQITQDFAELRPLKTKLTKSTQKFFYRPIPNLVSLVCFRYQYPCEAGKKTPDELCPRLFHNMKGVAQEADMKTLIKRGLTLDCTEAYRKKGQCKLFHFDGPLSQLKSVLDNSASYKLRKGHTAECDKENPPLYYHKLKTWDGQEFCC